MFKNILSKLYTRKDYIIPVVTLGIVYNFPVTIISLLAIGTSANIYIASPNKICNNPITLSVKHITDREFINRQIKLRQEVVNNLIRYISYDLLNTKERHPELYEDYPWRQYDKDFSVNYSTNLTKWLFYNGTKIIKCGDAGEFHLYFYYDHIVIKSSRGDFNIVINGYNVTEEDRQSIKNMVILYKNWY